MLANGDLLVAGRACAGTAGLACNVTFGSSLTLSKASSGAHGLVFLARITEDGVWQWARQLNSDQPMQVLDLPSGRFGYVAVHHYSSVKVDGLVDPIAGQDRDAVVILEFDQSGTTVRSLSVQTTQIIDEVASLCVNRQGEMHLALTFGERLIAGEHVLVSAGGTDAAVLRLGEGEALRGPPAPTAAATFRRFDAPPEPRMAWSWPVPSTASCLLRRHRFLLPRHRRVDGTGLRWRGVVQRGGHRRTWYRRAGRRAR